MKRMTARLLTAIGSASVAAIGACGAGQEGGGGSSSELPVCPDGGSTLDYQSCSTPNETCATTFQGVDANIEGCCTCVANDASGCFGPTWVCLGGSSEPGCPPSAPVEGTPCDNPTQSGTCVYCTSTPVLAGCRQGDGGNFWTRIAYWDCPVAVDGRPLVVEGTTRLAPAAHRRDWSAANAGQRGDGAVPASPAACASLAEAWLRAARYEHASIASFARFTLELLAFGAPPDLVASAQRAALDEIDHARRSFALASRLAGQPYGPGPLDVGGAAPRRPSRTP